MIKKFKEYNESLINVKFLSYKLKVRRTCLTLGIKNYTINDNGTIDVDDNVELQGMQLNFIPLKFGKVSGYFNCANNNLTTLENSPNYIGGDFLFFGNNIYDLKGCPKKIDGNINSKIDSFSSVPISEILLSLYPVSPGAPITFKAPIIGHYEFDIFLKRIFEIWNNFDPIYKKNGKWHVDSIRLSELYWYIHDKDFEDRDAIGVNILVDLLNSIEDDDKNKSKKINTHQFKFKNYIVDK